MIFDTSIKFLGFPRVRIWPVSLYMLRFLAKLLWLFSLFLGRVGYFLRRQVITYAPYFEGSATFKVEGIENLLGDSWSPPLVTDDVIKRILSYAVLQNFKSDK